MKKTRKINSSLQSAPAPGRNVTKSVNINTRKKLLDNLSPLAKTGL